jgi:hemerythrin-like metal-binding protein
MFEGKAEYAVNVGNVDAQHQILFAICGELHSAMSAGRGKVVLAQLLGKLIHYTETHFTDEERLLQSRGYPELARHRALHEALTKRVRELEADFNAGKIAMSIQLLQFLTDWLVKHIQGHHFAYARYLSAQKRRLAAPR